MTEEPVAKSRSANIIIRGCKPFSGLQYRAAVMCFDDHDKVGLLVYDALAHRPCRKRLKGHKWFTPRQARKIAAELIKAAEIAEKCP